MAVKGVKHGGAILTGVGMGAKAYTLKSRADGIESAIHNIQEGDWINAARDLVGLASGKKSKTGSKQTLLVKQ